MSGGTGDDETRDGETTGADTAGSETAEAGGTPTGRDVAPAAVPPRIQREPGGVDRKMLESLVCPVTQRPLDYDRERQELISRSANLAFPIRDGIPIMLPNEARSLD